MIIFYGLDNFLINQAVDKYLKEKNLLDQQAIITNYYLSQDDFEVIQQKIAQEINSGDLFNQTKILIINDYHLVFNNNLNLWVTFDQLLNNSFNKDVIIILKILSENLKSIILNSQASFFKIDNYKKDQLKNWVISKVKEYQIDLTQDMIVSIINKFPNSLNIINNELKKLANLNEQITQSTIEKFASKYFVKNPYKLINSWLMKDYQSFWWQYYNFWEKINYGKANLFNILIYQLELMRNIKLLWIENYSQQKIMNLLNISQIQVNSLMKSKLTIKKINQLLIKGHELDFQIKSGKISKNLAFDLFFF